MDTTTLSGEYLLFGIGAEEYAIDINLVQELREYTGAARLANAPDYLCGVVNLRGHIVPIADLRTALGHDGASDAPVAVILQLRSGLVGVVVDQVAEVQRLSAEQIRPAPATAGRLVAPYLLGVATLEARLALLLDMAAMLDELGLTEPAALAA